MGDTTKIEWCDATFNPWWGCTRISPACDHCYADTWARRVGQQLWDNGQRRTFGDEHWNAPLRWARTLPAKLGRRPRVFCASMADVFDKDAPEGERERLWQLIDDTPELDWLLLTKRIGNAAKMLPRGGALCWPHVWIGATIANQEEADRDIPKLLSTSAHIRFLSCEPLLGPINLADISDGHADRSIPRAYWTSLDADDSPPAVGHNALTGERWQRFGDWTQRGASIDWVISGGESGPKARPSHPDWHRSLRDQCEAAGVPFLFKQHGEHLPTGPIGTARATRGIATKCYVEAHGHAFLRVGKKAAGRELDGRTHTEFPA